MQYSLTTSNLENQKTDCLILTAFGDKLSPEADEINLKLDGAIKNLFVDSGLSASQHGMEMLYKTTLISAKNICLVQLGSKDKLKQANLLSTIAKLITSLKLKPFKLITLCLSSAQSDSQSHSDHFLHLVRVCENTEYAYTTTKKVSAKKSSLNKITFHSNTSKNVAALRKAIKNGLAISHGESLSRQLANLPANICTPSYLAKQAEKLAKNKTIKTKILDEKEMKKLSMGSLLSVSNGSAQQAKLIIMEYNGANKDQAPIVFVGKGLTFDSGGLSIKPAASMDEMKFDMCGGASVFGAMMAVSEMQLPINVVGVVPSSENLINGKATKPGDVVTSMSGKTIEVLNTDAEGRLILCDALTYVKRYKPAYVIDIATLTGAIIIALGKHASGLFSNDQKIAENIIHAGEQSADKVWQLPIWDDYKKQLKSNFADLANIGGRSGGSITAACFLSSFCEDFRWAHLDIAGTAWHSGSNKGSTGRPVPLLSQIMINHSLKPL